MTVGSMFGSVFYLKLIKIIMSRTPKIDCVKLRRYKRAGKSNREIAKIFNCSDSAISQRLKNINIAVAKVTQLEAGSAVLTDSLDTVAQLHRLNTYSNELLELLMAWIRGEKNAVELLDKHHKLGSAGVKVKFEDPKSLLLKVSQQILNQIKLQITILDSVCSFEAIASFQREIIDLIGEMDLELKKKFISRLREKKSIRSAVKF